MFLYLNILFNIALCSEVIYCSSRIKVQIPLINVEEMNKNVIHDPRSPLWSEEWSMPFTGMKFLTVEAFQL